MASMLEREEWKAFSDFSALAAAGLLTFIGLILAIAGKDLVIAFHGCVLLGAAGLAFLYILTQVIEKKEPRDKGGYADDVIRAGIIATVFWGVAGFLVGVVIALQLAFPVLNLDLPWTNFGRLRPVHTSAVIFAFGGNALLATSFYVVQRTCRARLVGRLGAVVRVLGLSAVHRAGGVRLCARHHRRAKEYAEPEWYVDLWLTIVWVAYLLVFLGTLVQAARAAHLRRELVLSRLHRHHRDAAHRQQPLDAGVASSARRATRSSRACRTRMTAMVVRPQRGRLLPHRRLPRHHVLFRAEAGRAADLFLPPLDRAFLVADLPLYLGGPAPSALHGPAGLGADARHDLLDHAVDAVLGRHDQRPDDALGRLGQAADRSGASASWSSRSPSTACRPSKAR